MGTKEVAATYTVCPDSSSLLDVQLTLKELIKITRLSGEHFSCFVSILSFSSLLAMIDTSALYAQFLSRPLTPPSVRNYVSTVKLLHVITGHSISQFTSYELRITLRGLERLAQHVPQRAPAITPAILCKLVSQVNLQDPSLVSYCAAFLFTFFLLTRVSNIVPRSRSRMHASFCLRCSDIVFTTDGLLVQKYNHTLLLTSWYDVSHAMRFRVWG